MITLPNNCKCSNLTVHPKNWDKPTASTKNEWYIGYWFYDLALKEIPGAKWKKQIKRRGMNVFDVLKDRQAATTSLLQGELDLLQNQQYNPLRKIRIEPAEEKEIITKDFDVLPSTPFITALRAAHLKLEGVVAGSTYKDIQYVINGVEKAAIVMDIDKVPIREIGRKTFKLLFQQCGKTVKDKDGNEQKLIPGWSNNRQNKYRANLIIVWNELFELEATEVDPFKKIKKLKSVKTIRERPTAEQRIKIKEFLLSHPKYYTFWRFLQIFFHSGARVQELLTIRHEHVDVYNQKYKVVIKKGKNYREVIRTIKDAALPFWKELIESGSVGQYLFSRNLQPGKEQIDTDQITKRWRMHIKKKLGVTADFYSIKGINLDETAAILDKEAAARAAAHTSTVITMKHYLDNEQEREHQRLKAVNNEF